MKIISSKDNSLIKKIRSLSVKKYREQFALFVVEGEKVVCEALKIDGLVEYLIVNEAEKDKYEQLIKKHEGKVLMLEESVYLSLSNTISPQSIMAVVHKRPKCSLGKGENVIILDHLQDPGNLGTIIRSSVAADISSIVLIDSVDPYNDKTIRSASGTIFYPNFIYLKIDQLEEFLKTKNLNLLIAEAGENNIFNAGMAIRRPYALVIGNEGNGVSENIKNMPHTSVSIPMNNRVESLNAAISASVLMFVLQNKK